MRILTRPVRRRVNKAFAQPTRSVASMTPPAQRQEAPGATAAAAEGTREPMVSDCERGLHADTPGAVPSGAAG